MEFTNTIFVIPARGGSKGIPGKNIKALNGKPLIHYSLEYARSFVPDSNICVTTDSGEIADCVSKIGYTVPFIRPAELATETSGSNEVMLHAIKHYQDLGRNFDTLILLQPTSPFRLQRHLREASALYNPTVDMVVSVKESEANPYYNLFEEQPSGYLKKSKEGEFTRRQDCPKVYQYNGSIYIINIATLKKQPIHLFMRVVKYIMEEKYSIDIDTPDDWMMAEILGKNMPNAMAV